ncbi:permease for cytosine/purines, uracil, thiamine, allantoin-domain-containing protein [Xylariomycetidae sp. FL0641]|nr:permease for cytosine/purines, uracil, thiamine, allantoin-domain-containing protein [Xylariomycetidae sp. FL0641]
MSLPPHSGNHGDAPSTKDVEKMAGQSSIHEAETHQAPGRVRSFLLKLGAAGPVEQRGVLPVPLEQRTSTSYSTYFSIWACMNINLLPITFGMLGTSSYALSLRDSALVILFFCLLTAAIPAFLGTLGAKTGLRQMIQARYAFGRYLVSVPVLLNLATLTGFCVVICVIGGQCLSAVAGGHLTPAVGIVVIGVLALGVSFCGYDVLHHYERWAWIPALVAIVIVTGCGGAGLRLQATAEPATAMSVLSFGMIVASYMIPYAALASDFTTYLNPAFPSWRLFLYGYAGLIFPSVLLMTLGAAIGGALSSIPEWTAGYETNAVGGVLASMVSPAGGFGKFVVVILSFTMLGNIAATMYSITLNFQILVPQLVVVPRYVFSVLVTAIVIPVSIKAATEFFASLENFISLIGYWSAAFVSVLITEYVVFRRCRYETYAHDDWNSASKLPLGAAALTAGIGSFALVIPSMAQVWWVGPIAKHTGDLGFEMAFVVTALLYIPLRTVEKKLCGR